MQRSILAIGGIYGALGVGGAALGAHLLRDSLNATQLENFQQAVSYFLVHGVVLVALGAWLQSARRARLLKFCAVGFIIGTALFSGGLMLWTALNIPWLRPLIPWGGSVLIAAWCGLALAACFDSIA